MFLVSHPAFEWWRSLRINTYTDIHPQLKTMRSPTHGNSEDDLFHHVGATQYAHTLLERSSILQCTTRRCWLMRVIVMEEHKMRIHPLTLTFLVSIVGTCYCRFDSGGYSMAIAASFLDENRAWQPHYTSLLSHTWCPQGHHPTTSISHLAAPGKEWYYPPRLLDIIKINIDIDQQKEKKTRRNHMVLLSARSLIALYRASWPSRPFISLALTCHAMVVQQ